MFNVRVFRKNNAYCIDVGENFNFDLALAELFEDMSATGLISEEELFGARSTEKFKIAVSDLRAKRTLTRLREINVEVVEQNPSAGCRGMLGRPGLHGGPRLLKAK